MDPAGRSLGRFFAEEIAAPLAREFYIGLPVDFDHDRRAMLHGSSRYESLRHLREVPRGLLLGMFRPGSLLLRAFGNPRGVADPARYNSGQMLRVEVPAGDGIGEPRGVAKAYASAIDGRLGLTPARPWMHSCSPPGRPAADRTTWCWAPR